MQAIAKQVTSADKCFFRNQSNCNIIHSIYCGSAQYPSECPILDTAIAVYRAANKTMEIEIKEQ